MFRPTLLFLGGALLVAALVPPALAVRVHVRVEGKTATIYGATEPVLDVQPAEVTVPEVPRIVSPLGALEAASVAGEFYYNAKSTSFGVYVDQIGRYPAAATAGWVFKVNGASPPVGAGEVRLNGGDRVLWYWAQFGDIPGGPPTLRLQRRPGGCYRVLAQSDAGRTSAASGAVLVVDGRRVRTKAGTACPGPHRGLVRAVRAGSVRSNAVR
ncbi:MAG: DUF4430 domain-containing protein [Actinobacteria bacterium]|nr:DUF4430 domain-containing protein [Actinomycetota bacterium]